MTEEEEEKKKAVRREALFCAFLFGVIIVSLWLVSLALN